MSASVKVMRSFDYCHFEVCLSSDEVLSSTIVNEMRKQAARLVDEAVRQYTIAKEMSIKKLHLVAEKERLLQQIDIIKKLPESEWNAEDKAKVKALDDKIYWDKYNYNYEDDEDTIPF